MSIVLTFNENVQKGTGNVYLTPSGGNGANTAITIDVDSVAFSGAEATLANLTLTLP